MLFWFVCLVLTLVVMALIVSPLLRPAPVKDTNPDVVLYRGQLAEIDRDVARAILEPEEAERARTEIARRLLAANKAKVTATAHGGPAPFATGFVVIVVLAVSFGAYYTLGAPGYGDLPLKARLAASEEIRSTRPNQAALVAAAPAPEPADARVIYVNCVV